jgi:hypothetical protein
MRGPRRVLALAAALLVAAACADLDVENLNNPDRGRALATPGDVETLISGAYRTWWYTQSSYYGYGMPASCMADEHGSSWGNVGMREACSEPRTWAYNNDPSYGYNYFNSRAWQRAYRALSAVRDGLLSIAGADGELGTGDDMQIGEGGVDTHRAIAWGKFTQALSTMVLALVYDQAVVVTERTDYAQPLVRIPYDQVADSAIYMFEEVIDLTQEGSFTSPATWSGGYSIDSDLMEELANSYIARLLAYTPRTVAERDAVDWNEVITRVNAGITEDYLIHIDDTNWYQDAMGWYTESSGWARTDLRMMGPGDQKAAGDPAGSWDDWEKETAGLRQPFPVDADDQRLPEYPPVAQDESTLKACLNQPRSATCGGDGLRMKMEYRDPDLPFRPERGTYFFSGYAAFPNWDIFDSDWIGDFPYMMKFEMDMLLAEAYIRTSQPALAYPLINATRVTYGGLAPVAGTGAVPYDDAPTNTRCTPRVISPFPSGTWQCGDLMEAMKWEKRMETYHTAFGLSWYDDRGWGDLVSGTITMLPVPGQELLLLLEEIYTFGGSPGDEGSAPDIVGWDAEGLRPLKIGEVPSEADIRARVELFERWNAADLAGERGAANMIRR